MFYIYKLEEWALKALGALEGGLGGWKPKKPRPPKWRGEAGGSERVLAVVVGGVAV
jgi:hypothetical protein